MSTAARDGAGAVNVSEYPGRPVLRRPAWTWEVPVYFFAGGLAGGSALLGLGAELAGNRPLARRCRLAAGLAAAACPPLLISDLGRPRRFLNMLRVFRPTSPMSMGTWLLVAFGGAAGAAALSEATGVLRPLGRTAGAVSGVLGPGLATYTAVLIGQTSIPAWERARTRLPAVFASSAAAGAGGLACVVTPPASARSARLLAVAGGLAELVSARWMRRSLGDHQPVYERGPAAATSRLAEGLTLAGAGLVALAGRRRAPAVLGGLSLLAGSLAQRVAIWRAGTASAALSGTEARRDVPG